MAGIGEASAILAVAQIGISLSNTLIAYVGEVQDAPTRIQRIGNEVLTTSERLKDIGELVDKNHQTRIFSDEGVLSAARCSEECKNILLELKNVLGKSGWHQQSKIEDKIEIDTSLFSTLRWPFLRTKLEVPRAELNRIKIDLMLLFSSAMALGASSAVDKAKFRQDIPGLSRTRDWAAKKAEQARRQALDRERDPRRRMTAEDEDWIEGEPQMLQEFVDFQERRMREEDDKRLAERAALLLVEKEEQKKKAEDERRVFEIQVLENHKREQDEKQARTAKLKAGFRDQLTRAGLGPDQIESILESPGHDYTRMAYETSMPVIQPAAASRKASDESVKIRVPRDSLSTTSRTNNKWRSRLPWRHPGKRRSDAYSVGSGNDPTSIESSSGPAYQGFLGGPFLAEAWLIDLYANQQVTLWPSDEWYTAKWKKALAERQTKRDVWHEFARLKPTLRTAILYLLKSKNEDKATRWSLLSIEIPQRSSRTRLLGHKSDVDVAQVIVISRKDMAGDENITKDRPEPLTLNDLPHRPVQISNASSIRGQAGDSANIHDGDEMREEILIPRDNMNRPIEAVRPYGQEVAILEAPPKPDRRSYRDEVIVRGTSPPHRERRHDSESRRRGGRNLVAMFDRDRYNRGRPIPGSRRYEEKDEDNVNRERPRSREKRRGEEDVIVRRRSKSRERDYSGDNIDFRIRSDSRERSYRDGKGEVILHRQDTNRFWSRDATSPSPPSPDFLQEDYSRNAGGDLAVTDDTRRPRHKDSSHQEQQLVIRRKELEPRRPRSFERRRPTIIDQEIGNPFPESSAERYIGSRDIEREEPRRNLTNDTFDDMMLSRRTTIERPGAPSHTPDQAIVRRTGGTRQVDGYMQDHVLDRSIRIHGEGKASSPPKIYNDIGRRPFSPSVRQYERWGRQQPIRRLLRSRIYSDSEDEDDVRINYAEKQASSESKLTDEQLIARTLEKFTNPKSETNPIGSVVIPTNIESVALPSVIAETTTKTATMSDEAGDCAPQAGHKRSGEGADSGESRRPSLEEVTDNGTTIAPGQATGVIVEEPAIMTDEDGPTQDVRSDMAKRRARFADEAESSEIARNGYKSDLEMDSDGDLRHEETDDRTTKARRKRREARRLLREADDLSDEHREIRRESTPRRTPNSRSATYEDTIVESEDVNGYRLTEVVRVLKPPIRNTPESEVSSDVYDD